MKIALAQINPHVGEIQKNVQKILSSIQEAKHHHVDLLVFPEMSITGYPPKDLLIKKSFIQANLKAISQIAPHTAGITIILGFVDQQDENQSLYNAAAVIKDQTILSRYHKIHLPNYDVFDEKRYFKAGTETTVIE